MIEPPARHLASLALATSLLVAACAGGVEPTAAPRSPSAPASTADVTMSPGPGATPTPTRPPAATGATGTGEPTADPVAAVRDALLGHPWAAATLTDVATGESFRIADFAGRTVFLETMAIWCTNCRRQQGEFQAALDRLDASTVAYVVLTIDPGETADQLARYKERQGFEGRYAVAGREASAALAAEFGSTVLNPPSVPLVIVSPSGSIEFKTGPKGPDEIVALAGG